LIIFAIFAWYPILKTVVFSFQNVSLNGTSTFVGFNNFERMLIDPAFGIAWRNSILFCHPERCNGFSHPHYRFDHGQRDAAGAGLFSPRLLPTDCHPDHGHAADLALDLQAG